MKIITIIMRVNWLIVLSAIFCSNTFASPPLGARLEIGLNILPSVIAANTRFGLDEDDKKHPVTVYIIYSEDNKMAHDASKKLSRIKNIRGHQLIIKTISIEQVLETKTDLFSVMVIIEPLIKNRDQLINFCRQRKILFFSPFRGDVINGVMTGYEVTNKVLPAVNLTALKEANIRLKAFFLRIAVSHD